MKQRKLRWMMLVLAMGAIMMLGACKKKVAPPPPPPPPPPAAPTASLTANPNTVDRGQSTMLTCDDVLDVESKEPVCLLRKAAVLAAVFRSGADSPPSGRIDHADGGCARSFRALAWRMAMKRLTRT